MLFKVENVQLGTARIEEVRGLMALLRAHGKRVFAYAPSPSTREYYLAVRVPTRSSLHPAGELALTGISQSVTFYKRAMDRLGVHVDLVRIGAYKGAMEPFVMNEQSPDVRANKNAPAGRRLRPRHGPRSPPTAPGSARRWTRPRCAR